MGPCSRWRLRNVSSSAATFMGVALLDYLVCSQQQQRRNRQAEGLRGLEIDDQFDFRRLFDGQIGWLRALEDLVHVGGGESETVTKTWTVRHKPTGLRPLSA